MPWRLHQPHQPADLPPGELLPTAGTVPHSLPSGLVLPCARWRTPALPNQHLQPLSGCLLLCCLPALPECPGYGCSGVQSLVLCERHRHAHALAHYQRRRRPGRLCLCPPAAPRLRTPYARPTRCWRPWRALLHQRCLRQRRLQRRLLLLAHGAAPGLPRLRALHWRLRGQLPWRGLQRQH